MSRMGGEVGREEAQETRKADGEDEAMIIFPFLVVPVPTCGELWRCGKSGRTHAKAPGRKKGQGNGGRILTFALRLGVRFSRRISQRAISDPGKIVRTLPHTRQVLGLRRMR
jgi:hypothetical protein